MPIQHQTASWLSLLAHRPTNLKFRPQGNPSIAERSRHSRAIFCRKLSSDSERGRLAADALMVPNHA
jgi:hypothetical protein